MNFTRRGFLKGVGSIGASIAMPSSPLSKAINQVIIPRNINVPSISLVLRTMDTKTRELDRTLFHSMMGPFRFIYEDKLSELYKSIGMNISFDGSSDTNFFPGRDIYLAVGNAEILRRSQEIEEYISSLPLLIQEYIAGNKGAIAIDAKTIVRKSLDSSYTDIFEGSLPYHLRGLCVRDEFDIGYTLKPKSGNHTISINLKEDNSESHYRPSEYYCFESFSLRDIEKLFHMNPLDIVRFLKEKNIMPDRLGRKGRDFSSFEQKMKELSNTSSADTNNEIRNKRETPFEKFLSSTSSCISISEYTKTTLQEIINREPKEINVFQRYEFMEAMRIYKPQLLFLLQCSFESRF